LSISLRNNKDEWISLSEDANAVLNKMCHAQNVGSLNTDELLSRTISKAVFTCAMGDLVDYEKEKEKLEQEIVRLQKEVKRSSGMLNNPGFINKAPAKKVEQEKEKMQKYQADLELTMKQLEEIEKKMK
jgi:valyl-tRNA synthetase